MGDQGVLVARKFLRSRGREGFEREGIAFGFEGRNVRLLASKEVEDEYEDDWGIGDLRTAANRQPTTDN